MVGLGQLQVHLVRWGIPDGQRHQAAGPRAVRDLLDCAEQGRPDRLGRADCRLTIVGHRAHPTLRHLAGGKSGAADPQVSTAPWRSS